MKIAIALAFTSQLFPTTAAKADKVVVEIFDNANALVQESDTAPYTFEGVTAGDYTLRASVLDTTGAVMGTPYTQAFTVTDQPGTVSVDLPSGATVTQSPD